MKRRSFLASIAALVLTPFAKSTKQPSCACGIDMTKPNSCTITFGDPEILENLQKLESAAAKHGFRQYEYGKFAPDEIIEALKYRQKHATRVQLQCWEAYFWDQNNLAAPPLSRYPGT